MKIYIQSSPSAPFEAIEVHDNPLGKGGQGAVYNIVTSRYSDYCIKTYKEPRQAREAFDRLAFMVQNQPRNIICSSSFRICWPVALAYNALKQFVGFMMPLAFPDSRNLLILSTYSATPIAQQSRYRKYPQWHHKFELSSTDGMKNRIKMLCNWAIALHSVHDTGKYIFIDIKPENVMATASGKISIVDTDSLQISQNGNILFPATAFTPEYLAPEGLSLHNSHRPFTIQCDYFAIAVVFYKILVGTHPYSGTVLRPPYDRFVTIDECIREGLFAFGDKKAYISFNSGLNLHRNFHNLPDEIQQLFIRAFGSNPSLRPTTKEWGMALHKAASDSVHIAASSVKPANPPAPAPKRNTTRTPKPATPRTPAPPSPTTSAYIPPKPNSTIILVFAVLSTFFCCMPLGIVAIVKAAGINTLWQQGLYNQAINKAADAKKWCYISVASYFILLIILAMFS